MMATGTAGSLSVLGSVTAVPFHAKTLRIVPNGSWQGLRPEILSSCNDIWRDLVLNLANEVFQNQFTPLEPTYLQLIGLANGFERINGVA
jgi:hypothetical protein